MSFIGGNLSSATIGNGAASNVTTRTIQNVSAKKNTSTNTEGEDEGTGALAGIGKTNNAPNFGLHNRISAAQAKAGISQAVAGAAGGLTGAQIGQAGTAAAQAASAAIGAAGSAAADGLAALGKAFDGMKGKGGGGGGGAASASAQSATGKTGGCASGDCKLADAGEDKEQQIAMTYIGAEGASETA